MNAKSRRPTDVKEAHIGDDDCMHRVLELHEEAWIISLVFRLWISSRVYVSDSQESFGVQKNTDFASLDGQHCGELQAPNLEPMPVPPDLS